MQLREYNLIKSDQTFNQLVEIYYQGGAWVFVRLQIWVHFGWHYGMTILGKDIKTMDLGQNQMDREVQVSKTIDGKTLLAKWIDLIGVIFPTDTLILFKMRCFYCYKKGYWFKWTSADISNDSLTYHRETWIPNLLQMTWKIFRWLNYFLCQMRMILKPAVRYRNLNVPQYVSCSHFDGNLYLA